jgi:hypothetical protein
MKKQLTSHQKQCKSRLTIGICRIIFVLGAFSGCSQNDSTLTDSTEEGTTPVASGSGSTSTKVAADQPADSTGAFASLKIDFATAAGAGAALSLTNAAAVTLDLGNGVVVNDARVNIKSIKLKANKERGADEKALKKELEGQKKSAESETEAAKKVIEEHKKAIEAKYEPLMESAQTGEEKDLLKAQMKVEMADVEQEKAALEQTKEEKAEEFESENDGNLKWRGPFVYDLVQGVVTPELPAMDILDGSYRRIEFKVKPARHLAVTDSMLNKSVYLAGTVLVANVSTPFEIALEIEQEFRLSGLGSVLLDATAENSMAIAFDPKSWLTGVDLSAAVASADGVIHID